MTVAGLSTEPKWGSPWSLELKLGTSRFECNLELDHPDYDISGGFLTGDHTLGIWLDQLEKLSVGRGPVVLLPFDFEDQCTAWLRVAQLPDGLVEVQAGWSLVGQYSLQPKDLRPMTLTMAAGSGEPLKRGVALVATPHF